jgi:hypothetical protein
MWRGWVSMVLVGATLAGCAADGFRNRASGDNAERPVWRRIAPDTLEPLPRHPAPEDSNRA